MKMQKTRLLIDDACYGDTRAMRIYPILASPPFFQSGPGRYVHRIRSGTAFEWVGWNRAGHTCFRLWCGQTGHVRRWTKITDAPDMDNQFCATCEGRAIGAGLAGTPEICGRPVMYAPRQTRDRIHYARH